ncbi:hypothetical protein FH972_022757 [Carpinus fangiana]|uniref:NAD+ kinase n=1 Tax=Carpinus fangiana TaxID=176857 RepID=A0A5N6KT70_9ROSI|nr:hypothetical protein FH972_022757 [Carpinus fangiana]
MSSSANRRRSSLTISDKPFDLERSTSCFVHGFLQDERLHDDSLPHTGPENEHYLKDFPNDKAPNQGKDAHLRSRTLTKKQLSDMAFSMRELSRRLGRFKLKLKVRNVFLLTKAHDPTLIVKTREVADWLLSDKCAGPYTVFVEETLRDNKRFDAKGLVEKDENRKNRLKFWTNEDCAKRPHIFDIVLALGGDGTVLYASWLFQRVVPPVIAFALGSLGFLTKFDFDAYANTLTKTFHEGLTVSLRLRLEATIMRSQAGLDEDGVKQGDLIEELIGKHDDKQFTHMPEKTHDILNDLVCDRGPSATMSSIEVFGDNYHITTIQADGVCVATPTGSTAYNLAAGGSLCHPDNPVIMLTAICAHTLSFRPIVLPDTVVLRLGVPYDARTGSWVSFDGRERAELRPGDYVTISASRFPFPTVLPLGRGGEDWIDSLSQTLNWNSRQRQKSFKEWK